MSPAAAAYLPPLSLGCLLSCLAAFASKSLHACCLTRSPCWAACVASASHHAELSLGCLPARPQQRLACSPAGCLGTGGPAFPSRPLLHPSHLSAGSVALKLCCPCCSSAAPTHRANKNSYKYSGLANLSSTVDVASADGAVVVSKSSKKSKAGKLAGSVVKKNARRTNHAAGAEAVSAGRADLKASTPERCNHLCVLCV